METMLDRLKKYFENTSNEQVMKDWKQTEKYDEIDSPSIETFIRESKLLIEVGKLEETLPPENFINNFENPNFSSDFFLPKL